MKPRPRTPGSHRVAIPLLPALLLFALTPSCDRANASNDANTADHGESAGNAKRKKSTERPLVRTEPMVIRSVLRQIKDVGHAESLHVIDVLSKVSERVIAVLVDEGDEVRRDQVLARLDQRVAELRNKELDLQVKEAQQLIDEMKVALDEAGLKQAAAKVEEAKKQRDHKSNTEIATGILSPNELDDSLVAHQKAMSDLRISELAVIKARVLLSSAKNGLARAKLQLEQAQIDLEERTIKSPIDGVIAVRHITVGDSVAAGSGALFNVVDHKSLVCVLSRTQQDLPHIHKGQAVFLTTDAYPGEEFKATIDVISPVIEKESGSFKLRIRIVDATDKIRPGMFLRTRIVTGQSAKALTLSKRAVVFEGDRPLAWVVRDGRARRIYIEPGIEEREFLEVTNKDERGFREGDVVVISGHKNLRDGREVEVVEK